MKLRVTYFPMEQKYSVWTEDHKLVKEWFETREEAEKWIKENSPEEKAKSLISKFQQLNAIKISDNSRIEYPTAKQCAILVIEEILEDYEQFKYKAQTGKEYWQEVRAEVVNQ